MSEEKFEFITTAAFRCECGFYMLSERTSTHCVNSDCRLFEKRFALPKVELTLSEFTQFGIEKKESE
jgi:hypothetical protein